MISTDDIRCPKCSGLLKHYDSVSRIIKEGNGNSKWIRIRRLRCVECKKIHRELPDFIYPYKHYNSNIIDGVLNGDITSEMLTYEDYPCEMTMTRWMRTRK